jgi:hypothetical protein
MLDTFLDWAVVGLPTIVSALGVWISMKPPDSKRHSVWRYGLIAFGVVVSVLTFWQQNRTRVSQIAAQRQLQNTLDQARTELQSARMDSAKSSAFLSGQISVLTNLTANPPRNPDVKSAAEALRVLSTKPLERDESVTELAARVPIYRGA